MRISTDHADWLGYPAHMLFRRHGIKPVVYLDGERVSLATMADTETGEVTRLVKDESGRFRVGPGYVERETVHGRVTIDLVGPDPLP